MLAGGRFMKLIRFPGFWGLIAAGLLGLGAAGCGAAATNTATPAPADTVIPADTATATAAPAADRVGRGEVLQSLTALVFLPGYEAAADAMARWAESVEGLCAAPGPAGLAAARADWAAARQGWLRTEAYRFGPAMERRSASLVDWWPVDTGKIDRLLEGGDGVSGDGITGELVREYLPSTQRGLGAGEYLLFGPGSDVLASGSGDGGRRCDYLRAAAGVAAAETAGIWADWQGGGGAPGYAGFYDGTAASSLLDREAEAIAVRSLVFQVRAIANMRLGAALGVDGAADVSAIPAGYADNGKADLLSQWEGIAGVYRGGAGGLGLSDRVRTLSADTDARMLAAIESVIGAIGGLEGSLMAELEGGTAAARAVYDNVKVLQRILNTEIVSLLGVSVGFADTDGDS